MKSFEWSEAPTIDKAVAQLEPSAGDGVAKLRKVSLKAGGVDLMDLMKENLHEPERIVNIRNIPGLDKVEDDGKGGLLIGPLVTLSQLDLHPLVKQHFPILGSAAGQAATPQIRNMATLGGNLLQRPRCWYFRSDDFPCRRKGGDICYAQEGENQYHALFANSQCAIVHPSATASPLIALGASIKVKSPIAERTIPLEKFFVLPNQDIHKENILASDEMVTQIIIPPQAAGTKMAYIRQTAKDSFDWPLADVAVVLEMDGTKCKSANIILGAAAPAPWRSKEAERAIVGKTIDAKTAGDAAAAAMKPARPMTQNEYKVALFHTVIRRAILAAALGPSPDQQQQQGGAKS